MIESRSSCITVYFSQILFLSFGLVVIYAGHLILLYFYLLQLTKIEVAKS
jgi:hypothetical protein